MTYHQYANPNRIIASWPGRGTGDTEYRTADGRIWVPTSYTGAKPPMTNQSFGTATNGEIKRDRS